MPDLQTWAWLRQVLHGSNTKTEAQARNSPTGLNWKLDLKIADRVALRCDLLCGSVRRASPLGFLLSTAVVWRDRDDRARQAAVISVKTIAANTRTDVRR